MRTAATSAGLALGLLMLCASAPAAAQSTGSVTINWRAAPGPVAGYDVYVSINDAEMIYHSRVTVTSVALSGSQFQEGDALRVQVVGVDVEGTQGPPSEVSDVVYFSNVPAPAGLTVVDGTPQAPIRLSWNPIPHVQSYVVYRSEAPGQPGQYIGLTSSPSLEDRSTQAGVVYYYSVAAINGRQMSEFGVQVAGIRGGNYPNLAAAPGALAFQFGPGGGSSTQNVRLSNSGDWELSFAAWPGAPWIQLPQSVGVVGATPVDLVVSVDAGLLPAGVHQGVIQVFAYYTPPPGETFVLGEPVQIPITVNVSTATNSPPEITSPLTATVDEGEVIELVLTATDADPGDPLTMSMGQLPGFAAFEDLGGGQGRLTLSPGAGTAGVYEPVLVAWDNRDYTVEPFTITVVGNQNSAPQISPISDVGMRVGSEANVLVFASDPDGDNLALTTSALPSFASFTDLGGGRGEIALDPSLAHRGEYLIVVGAVDDGSPAASASVSFRLTVRF